MSIKKILMQAVRNPKHRKELEKMSEAEAAELLRQLQEKKEGNNA